MITFIVEDSELAVAEKWIKEQKIKHPKMSQGRFGYEFTPTGIGDGKSVFDNLTGERKDITDYNEW
jgi:hypothetical protein